MRDKNVSPRSSPQGKEKDFTIDISYNLIFIFQIL